MKGVVREREASSVTSVYGMKNWADDVYQIRTGSSFSFIWAPPQAAFMVQKHSWGVWGLILGLPLAIYMELGSYVAFLSISMLIHKILGLGKIMWGRGIQAIKSYNKEPYLMLWS